MYIIRHEVAVYHQCSALHIIKPQERYTLKRDDIQPHKGLMISTTLRAAMICQTCGLDKKSRIKMIRLFWCGRRDLNPHESLHWNLKPARLPIPPHLHCAFLLYHDLIKSQVDLAKKDSIHAVSSLSTAPKRRIRHTYIATDISMEGRRLTGRNDDIAPAR